jgi:hypothetical protein
MATDLETTAVEAGLQPGSSDDPAALKDGLYKCRSANTFLLRSMMLTISLAALLRLMCS